MKIKISIALWLFCLFSLIASPVVLATYESQQAETDEWVLAAKRAELIKRLNQCNSGVEVVSEGEIITVILSVDKFFRFPTNTRLFFVKNAVLDDVAALLETCGNQHIWVSGHTDDVGTDVSKFHRSEEQAKTIVGYLWSAGIPLARLTAIGCGDTEPVSSNTTAAGSAANRRIEITTGAEPRYLRIS